MDMPTKLNIQELRRTNLRRWIQCNCEDSQARFVDATGINQGELSGLLRNKAFGEKKARKLEELAGMPYLYLDSVHTVPLDTVHPVAGNYQIKHLANSFIPVQDGDSDFVGIRKVDFKISAGVSGYAIEYLDGDKAPIFFRRDWLDRKGYSPNRLTAIPVKGESMETSLFEGDLVVINLDDTKPLDGEVFACNYEGELVIKRMIREAGVWYLASDNTDKRRFPNKVCHDDCFIIGRIIYKQSERI